MAATHYGLNAGSWEAGPDFRASRGADGTYTGSVTFRMPQDTWENGAYTSFAKGTAITAVFPELNAFWSFLQIESAELQAVRGGIAEIRVELVGFNSAEFESDREVTYSLSGVLTDRSIMQHPLFITEVLNETNTDVAEQRVYLVEAIESNLWARRAKGVATATEIGIEYIPSNGERTAIIDNPVIYKWWVFCIDKGNRTYKAPTLEWTKQTANAGGLSSDDIEDIGKAVDVGDVDGTPPTPFNGYFDWMKVSADDVRGSGGASTSETWQLSPPGGYPFIYKFELWEIDPTDG